MGKAPAFQFYAADFLVGTLEMTLQEIGLYIKLLALSWDKGALPNDSARLARLAGIPERDFKALWIMVSEKWELTDAGFINERLEEQRKEREAYAQAQADKGRRSGDARRLKRELELNTGSTGVQPVLSRKRTEEEPETNSSIFDLQSSTRESKEHSLSIARANPHAKATNLINGSDNRKHGEHAYCLQGRRESLCVSTHMLAILVDAVGGDKDEAKRWLVTEVMPKAVEALGDKPVPDALAFWKAAVKQAIERRSTPSHELYDPDAGRRTREMFRAKKAAAGF